MSIFDPSAVVDTKTLDVLNLNRITWKEFDELSAVDPDQLWFIQSSTQSPIVVDTTPRATKLSQLQNDVGYLTTVSWSQVTGKPTIPTQTSQLTNNSGYVTSAYVQQQVLQSKTKWRDWLYTEWPLDALTFTALSPDSWVRMDKGSSAPTVSLEYTTNGQDWSDFIVGSTTITLPNIGMKVAIRAKTTNQIMANVWDGTQSNYFRGSGALKISGNINSLLDKNPEQVTSLPELAFASLFSAGNPDYSFRDASELTLPATSLGKNCYCRLFYLAASLEKSPYLPATTLADYSYYDMFNGCSSLNTIKIAYTGNFSGSGVPTENPFHTWVNGVSTNGTFYYNGSDTTRGASAIPTNWTVQTF